MRGPVDDDDPGTRLGGQLRRARLAAGLTLRDVARELGVSASFVSQLENGKSRPSVATLSALARLLGVSLDQLFQGLAEAASSSGASASAVSPSGAPEPESGRAAPTDPTAGMIRPPGRTRLSVTAPGRRTRLVMTSGVSWEELSRTDDGHVDFIEVSYPPGSSSTVDDRLLRHNGHDYGYVLEGELRVTLGGEEITLGPGDAIGLDAALPHLIKNVTSAPARGVWFIHHDTVGSAPRTPAP